MRDYQRGYDELLIGFREERIANEQAGYTDAVKIVVSTLVARGENTQHIAQLLNIDSNVVTGWYRDLFLNQEDMVFAINEFTYVREKNVIRADARTKGCIVKAVLENMLTEEEAMEAVGVDNRQTITQWVNTYSRDYDVMVTLPAGVDYVIKTAYAYNREDATELQELIFRHDREENELASLRRQQAIARR